MMKSFFKKLAFVMALAMVVTMAAPAAAKAYAADMYLAYQGKKAAVSEINLKAGSSEDLCFKNAPANWAELSKTWASDNEAVAIVDKNGVVTAIADGTAKITFTLGDGTAASVTVNVGEAKVYDVTLGNAEDKAMKAVELKTGATLDLNFYGVKDWAAGKYDVAWSSNAPEVASVDKNGVVTAVKAGTATVTAAIVNNNTGAVMNVTPVVVTVPEEKKVEAFTAKQVSTNTVELTFATAPDATKLSEELAFVMNISGEELTLPVNSVSLKDNVATVSVFTTFVDGETYTFVYGEDKASIVASCGEIYAVAFDYYTGDDPTKNIGVAYANTEDEDFYATFVPKFYDVNGIDITAKYDVDDFEITYEAAESDAYEIDMDTITFDKAGAAAVTITVAWTDDDAEDVVKQGLGVVVATKLPNIAVEYVNGGFIKVGDYKNDDDGTNVALTAFTTNPWSVFWSNNLVKNSYTLGSSGTYIFAALMQDNRGNKVVTGNTGYEFGEFTFKSSNENVLDIMEDGELVFYEPGTASVLIYFTAADDEEETPVFVGAKKLTVKAAPYAASYKILNTSVTTASDTVDAGKNNVSFNLQVYNQYGSAMKVTGMENLINVEATSDTNEVTTTGISYNSDKKYYEICFDADDFDIEDKKYKSFKYKVSIEESEDLTDKIKGGSTTVTLKITDTEAAKKALNSYLGWGDTDVAVANSFDYNLGGGYGVDLAVKDIVGYKNTKAQSVTKLGWGTGINYLTTGDLALTEVPADHFVEIGKDVTTGDVGYLYYRISAPSKAVTRNEDGTVAAKHNWALRITNGGFLFQWNGETLNDAEWWNPSDQFDGYAEAGTYAVTVYTAKKNDGKLTQKATYSFNVYNSQEEVKYVGFNQDFGNETTTPIVDAEAVIEEIIQTNLVFTFDGKELKSAEDWAAVGAYIDFDSDDTNITVSEGDKIRVRSLAVVVPLDDGTYGDSGYTYTSVVKVGKTIEQAQ